MFRMLLAALAAFTAAAQTQVDLRTQARTVDFGAATSTKPVKTGTALPATCSPGEMFFKTDAPAGSNLYGCSAANTWSVQGGVFSQDCGYDTADQTLKCRDGGGAVYAAVRTAAGAATNQWVDYIAPTGVPHTSQPTAAAVGALADPGSNGIPYRSGAGAATPASANHIGALLSCQDAGAVNAYACSLSPAISAYTAGTTYWFKANTTNTGSATLNLNQVGAKAIVKQANQQLTAGDIKAGQWVMATYDGIAMQMQSQTGNPGSGSVASVFGRSGMITPQSGDYTTAQVTEHGNLYYTDTRAQAAFSFPGVVKLSAGALDCPTCLTSTTAADTDLNGSFPHLTVARLQGRSVAGTAPADRQYLGWNGTTAQWEPKTLPAAQVNSLFGRTGAVTAQSGDYSFAQISGAAAVSQLPATVMRMDAGNQVTAGTQDMSGADHTLPMKSGLIANLPGTCKVGETYFATDAPPGSNVYGCTAGNTWSAQGTNLTVASDGTVVGWRPKTNFMTGPGLTSLMTDNGSQIDILWALDTAVVQTQPGEQRGGVLLCESASGSSSAYQCSLTPTLDAYTKGMVLHWKPDVSGTGGPISLNVDTLKPVPIKLRDGVSDAPAGDIVAGQLYDIWYDGARFRLMMPTDRTGSGAPVTWDTLPGKPSIFPPSAHAASHENGGSDEIATATPAPNAIPKADASGKLTAGWLPASSGADLGYTAENTANKGQANGYASLDSTGKVPPSQLPAGAGLNAGPLIFDGSTTTLADGSTVSWTCGSGSGARCTANWTVPTGINRVRVVAWSGGGGGGGSNTSYAGYGGAGGGYWEGVCSVTPGNSIAVVVGLGGVGTSNTGNYSHGGNSSFGACFTLLGGMAGTGTQTGTTSTGWGGRGQGTLQNGWTSASNSTALVNGTLSCYSGSAYLRSDGGGCSGDRASSAAPGAGKSGGDALNGGGGGGGGAFSSGSTAYAGGAGGSSFGGGGPGGTGGGYDGTAVTACTAGAIPGGGGGASGTTSTAAVGTGCAGARGEIRVFYAK